jgi:hypothetical protein
MNIELKPRLPRVDEQWNIAQDVEPKRSSRTFKTVILRICGSPIQMTNCITIPKSLLVQADTAVLLLAPTGIQVHLALLVQRDQLHVV